MYSQLLSASETCRNASGSFGMGRVSIPVNHPNNFVNSSHTTCIPMSYMGNTGSRVVIYHHDVKIKGSRKKLKIIQLPNLSKHFLMRF